MNPEHRLKQQLVEAVNTFQKRQLAVSCESIEVDLHSGTLVVTLYGATCPAEKDYARNIEARELLEKFYGELFGVIRPILEAKIQQILGQRVERSKFSIDPASGAGVILLTLIGEARSEEQMDGAPCPKTSPTAER